MSGHGFTHTLDAGDWTRCSRTRRRDFSGPWPDPDDPTRSSRRQLGSGSSSDRSQAAQSLLPTSETESGLCPRKGFWRRNGPTPTACSVPNVSIRVSREVSRPVCTQRVAGLRGGSENTAPLGAGSTEGVELKQKEGVERLKAIPMGSGP